MRREVQVALTSALALAATSLVAGCPADAEPKVCTSPPPETCAPLYEPTFEQIFTRTLQPSCGLGGASCHSDRGRQGGLAFTKREESYDLLLSTGAVRPGDPGCSEMMVRILSTDGKTRMPPGRSLDPGAQCAIRQWIANGAKP